MATSRALDMADDDDVVASGLAVPGGLTEAFAAGTGASSSLSSSSSSSSSVVESLTSSLASSASLAASTSRERKEGNRQRRLPPRPTPADPGPVTPALITLDDTAEDGPAVLLVRGDAGIFAVDAECGVVRVY